MSFDKLFFHIHMSHAPLSTYMRMYRRRAGFSQEELSLLLGLVSAANISRHECHRKVPSLRAALCYEIICGAPVRDLFLGEVCQLEKDIRRRATSLQAKWEKRPKSRMRDRKLAALTRLVGREPIALAA